MIKVKKNSAVNTNISILIGGYDAKMTSKFLWESNSPSDGMVADLNDSLDNYDEIILIGKITSLGYTYMDHRNILVSLLTDSKFVNMPWYMSYPSLKFTGDKRKVTILANNTCSYYGIVGIKY